MSSFLVNTRSILLFIFSIFLLPALAQQDVELKLQKGHSEKINEILFTPSGERLVSCSDDKTIKIWDVKSGKELRTLVGHQGDVLSIALNKGGTTIFSGGDKKEKKVIFWSTVTGEKTGELGGFEGGISAIKFSPFGNRIAVLESMSGFQTRVSIWDEALSAKRFDLKLPADFYAQTIAFHPGNNHLVVGGKYLKKAKDKNVFIFDSSTGEELQQVKGTSSSITQLYYSRIGSKLAVVGTNIQIYSTLGEYTLQNDIPVNGSHAMFYDKDRKIIFSKGNDLYKWDLATNTQLDKVVNGHNKAIGAVNITLDEKYFVTAANDNNINFFDEESFTKIPHFSGVKPDQVQQISFDKSYRNMYSIMDNNRVQYWQLQKAKLDFIYPKLERGGDPVGLDFSDDKSIMTICGSQNKGVEVWDVKKNVSQAFLPHTSFVSKAVNVPNSTKVVGLGRDRTVLVWDRSNPGAPIYKMRGHRSDIYSVAVAPDGSVAYTGSKDKTLKVWDLNTGLVLHSVTIGMEVNDLAISPDGSKLVLGCGNTTTVFGDASPTALYVLETSGMADYAKVKNQETFKKLLGHSASVVHVSFSPDGSMIFSGGADSKIFIWDAATLGMVQKIEGHSAPVNTLTLDKSGKYLVSGSNDATTRFWELSNLESNFNMVTFNNGNEYIVYDKNNYYSCTKNGAKNVHFVIDNKVYLFEQFDLRLNRPDLVFANLPGVNKDLLRAYYKAYKKRLRKMNFTEDMLSADFNVPEVQIVNEDDIPYQSATRNIVLKIKAQDKAYALDRLNVWINDVPLYGKEGVNLRGEATTSIEKDLDITLSKGKNKIQVSVLNQRGAESFKATKFVYYEGGGEKNDLYVIGIGVSRFKDSEFNLDYAAKDATDVVNQLAGNTSKYNNIYTKLVLNEEATRSNIKALKSFLMNSKIDDNVIVFIASHGLIDDEMDYYLATTDINFYTPSQGGLIYDDLEGLLDGIPSRKKLLLIDACHSGEVDTDESYKAPIPPTETQSEEVKVSAEITAIKESSDIKSRGFKKVGGPSLGMASTFELMKQLFNDLRRGSGATVISSAGGKEFALESSQWNNGVFTYCFLQGLVTKDADLNEDGAVDVTEIRNYVADNVKVLTNGEQNPTFRKENIDNNYKIW